MKSNSDKRPEQLLALGDGSYHFNYNIEEVEREETTGFDYDYVHINNPTYGDVVSALIRKKYSVDDELALHRQKEEKAKDFQEYHDFCEECKAIVRPLFS